VNRVKDSDYWGALVVLLIATLVFLIAAPLDPEPYHDGSQLPAAIAVADGLRIHQDVFSAYGFLTAWLQGAAVFLFGPYLVTIRIFTAIVLISVSILIYILVRWTSGKSLTAVGIAVLWTLAWPGASVIWGTPLLPWPSVVFLAFQLAVVLLTLRALLSSKPKQRNSLFFVAGIFLGLAVLTRINYGFFLAIALALSLLILHQFDYLTAKNWLSVSLGTLIAIAIPLSALALQGGFTAFWDQSILGPIQGKAIVKATEWFYLENGYLWGSALLAIALGLIILLGNQQRIPPAAYKVLVTISVFAMILWTSTAVEASPLRQLILSRLTWAPALDGQVLQPMYLAAIITPLVAVVTALLIFTKSQRIAMPKDKIFLVLFSLTATASLVQLYPVADPNHLWWAAPIPLALAVYALRGLVKSGNRWAVSALFIVPSISIALVAQVEFINRPRVEITSGTLSGMRIAESLYPSVAKVDALLINVEPGTAEFKCKDGLFAVWNGQYLASTPGYVDYAYLLESADPGSPPLRTFECLPPGSEALNSVQSTGDFVLSYFSVGNLIEVSQETKPELE